MNKLLLIIFLGLSSAVLGQSNRAIFVMIPYSDQIVSEPTYDSDATAYFTSAGITDTSMKRKYSDYVTRAKANGTYTKCVAFYPFLGGTAASHKWNAIDPRDLDAAYRLTFSGGITHQSTGVLPNGSTGFANTYYNVATTAIDNIGIGYYSRTNSQGTTVDMGAYNATGTKYLQIFPWFGGTFYGNPNMSGINASTAATNSLGFRFAARTSGSSVFFQSNATQYVQSAAGASVRPNANVYLFARNDDGVASLFSPRELACAGIWVNVTQAEALLINTNIQTLITDLGR